jgi:hypothetical protein
MSTRWQDLIVTTEGETWDPLGELVRTAPANLDDATIEDGRITAWPGFFISAPGEAPAHDTPRGSVDWTGFATTLAEQSGH